MTFELAAVIAIGAAFLGAILAVVEHPHWTGAAARPVRGIRRWRLIRSAWNVVGNSILAWLVGGLVERVGSLVGGRGVPADEAVRIEHRPTALPAESARPVALRPTRIVVSGERASRQRGAGSATSLPTSEASRDSPRLRLWRDASAILVVLALVAVALTIVSQQPQGGVLSTTATPTVDSAEPAGAPGGRQAGASTSDPGATDATVPGAMSGPPGSARSIAPLSPAAAMPAGPAGATARPPGQTGGRPPARPSRAPAQTAPADEPSLPPVARFAAVPPSGIAPLAIEFEDRSDGPITAWSWDFGDGATSTESNPGHVFATDGSYGVTLTVTGPGGSDSAVATIRVAPVAPPS